MDEKIKDALEHDRLIDITTLGRKTGKHRKIEIGFHYIDGEYYITGLPGKRGWYANLLANSQFTLHLKLSVQKDLRAEAIPIRGETERRKLFEVLALKIRPDSDFEEWVASSPLVRVKILET